MNKFKVANNGGDDWLICWTGQDEKGVHWNVTTDQVRASQLHQFSKGAEEDARLIAKLLDMHYTGQLIHTENIQSNLANYNALQSPMPCGHLARYAVNGEEGTQYCVRCAASDIENQLNQYKKFFNEVEWCGDQNKFVCPDCGNYIEQGHRFSCRYRIFRGEQ